MKIGDRISCYEKKGWLEPRTEHKYTGTITGINKTTKQVRLKSDRYGFEFDVPSDGYEWIGMNFIIFDTYRWDNSNYISDQIRNEENDFKERSHQRAIKKGWELEKKDNKK